MEFLQDKNMEALCIKIPKNLTQFKLICRIRPLCPVIMMQVSFQTPEFTHKQEILMKLISKLKNRELTLERMMKMLILKMLILILHL